MKTKLATIFTLSTALVLSGTLSAHEDEDDISFHRVGHFSEIDENGDGKVSREEYLNFEADSARSERKWREEHWEGMVEKFDFNDDDHITTAEVEEFVNRKMAEVSDRLKDMEWFGDWEFDFEGDDFVFDFDGHDFHGRFDDGEFAERLAERMERVEEHIEKSIRRLEEIKIRRLDDDMIFSFAPQIELKRGFRVYRDDLDSNEDGVITREEFLEDRGELFDRLDKNDDGRLDEEELDRFPFHGSFAFHWDDEDEDRDNE